METISKAELAELFGTGWHLDTIARPQRVREILIRQRRSLSRYVDDVPETFIDKPPLDSAEAVVEARRAELESKLKELVRAQTHAGRNIFRRLAHRRFISDADDKIDRLFAEIDRLDGAEIVPLPDHLEHYGRLDLGAPIWVLDRNDQDRGFPIHRTLVVAESAPRLNRSIDDHRPAAFEYRITSDERRALCQSDLPVMMGRDGLAMLGSLGLSAHLDMESAAAARQAFIAELNARIEETGAALPGMAP